MLYLDTSAAAKLLLEEAESAALEELLANEPEPLVTSRVGVIELRRVARRGGASAAFLTPLQAAPNVAANPRPRLERKRTWHASI